MPFFVIDEQPEKSIFDGKTTIRTLHGEKVMMSFVNLQPHGVVEEHSHPHEQGGIVVEGKMRFTIGGETRTVASGEAFLIPAHVPHRAEAIDGPCVALDIFSPIREDYVALANRYIPPEDAP